MSLSNMLVKGQQVAPRQQLACTIVHLRMPTKDVMMACCGRGPRGIQLVGKLGCLSHVQYVFHIPWSTSCRRAQQAYSRADAMRRPPCPQPIEPVGPAGADAAGPGAMQLERQLYRTTGYCASWCRRERPLRGVWPGSRMFRWCGLGVMAGRWNQRE